MNVLESLVRSSEAQALGQALAHSLWQGAAAALALGTVLGIWRSARVRYGAACVALVLMLAAFGITFLRAVPNPATRVVVTESGSRHASSGAGNPVSPGRTAPFLPWVAPFWAAGVLLFHLRAIAGWTAARRLRTTGVCAPEPEWTRRLADLRGRMRASRPVLLLESSLAKTPLVIGHLRPVILMPVGLLAGLPVSQVEAILLHELAHVRRRDYLVNLLQTWVEGLFFYHPAAWWISRVIRAEREHCCDDLAASVQGDRFVYASALAAVEQSRWSAEPAVAATGGNLVKRIRRLLHPDGPRPAFGPLLSATLIVVVGAAVLAGLRAQTPAPPANSPYAKWVNEDVTYIIDDRERAAFHSLQTDEEREKFIEQFWLRRDPTPGTAANEFKEEHYRRIAYANERYATGTPGWKTDRGRSYIIFGPPDEIESHPSGGPGVAPYEEWLYRSIAGVGRNVFVRFEDPKRTGEYRQTVDPRTIRK
jgi:GWxTD domain-containing protein